MAVLLPSNPAPKLVLETVAHGGFDLAVNAPPNGTMVVFYRGEHCPICHHHIKEMDDRIGDFALRGISVVAVSSDALQNAKKLVDEMQIIRLPVAHSFDLKSARNDWGLLISQGAQGSQEPDFFAEPGHFWIRQDGSVAFSAVLSVPYMRPDATQILRAVDKTLARGDMPRGAYSGDLP